MDQDIDPQAAIDAAEQIIDAAGTARPPTDAPLDTDDLLDAARGALFGSMYAPRDEPNPAVAAFYIAAGDEARRLHEHAEAEMSALFAELERAATADDPTERDRAIADAENLAYDLARVAFEEGIRFGARIAPVLALVASEDHAFVAGEDHR